MKFKQALQKIQTTMQIQQEEKIMIHSHELEDSKMQMKKTDGSGPLARQNDQEKMKKLAQLVRACVNFYGVVDSDFLIRQISRLPEAGGLTLWEYVAQIDSLIRQDDNLLQQGPWLYTPLACPSPEDLADLLEDQECLPYWAASIESLLPYADEGYYEQTQELEALAAFLADRCAAADRLVRIAGRLLRLSTAEAVSALLMEDADCTCIDQEELLSLISAAEAVTRKVCLRGHTPQEESVMCED
jgi:hypothetical protein